MSATLTVDKGGAGEAIRVDGEVLHTIIDRAFAPGAPIEITIAIEGAPLVIRAKTIGSKRREDGRFEVRLRLTNLAREERARLAML